MTPTEQRPHACRSSEPARPRLEDLIPIAVVIAAGCESCAAKMVERALQQGSAKPLIERTLRIVEGLRSRDCFAQAVGPEVIARMANPLQAGRQALRREEEPGCCGSTVRRSLQERGATAVG